MMYAWFCREPNTICNTRTDFWKELLMEYLSEIETNWCQERCKGLALHLAPCLTLGYTRGAVDLGCSGRYITATQNISTEEINE